MSNLNDNNTGDNRYGNAPDKSPSLAIGSLQDLNFTAITVEHVEHILTLTLNRPEKRNAINQTMINELIHALDYAKQKRDVRVVILAANGPVFCAGGDLKAMASAERGDNAVVSNIPHRGEFDDLALRLHHLNKPTIAKIQGPVLAGALMFVSQVTHAIAVDSATFAAPEILRGLWPFQVMASLCQIMTPRAGLDFIMRGQAIKAPQAVETGLINDSVPAADLDKSVAALANELASLAPGAMALGLQAYHAQLDMSVDKALPYLKQQLQICLEGDDAKEGIAAFFEKRVPVWK